MTNSPQKVREAQKVRERCFLPYTFFLWFAKISTVFKQFLISLSERAIEHLLGNCREIRSRITLFTQHQNYCSSKFILLFSMSNWILSTSDIQIPTFTGRIYGKTLAALNLSLFFVKIAIKSSLHSFFLHPFLAAIIGSAERAVKKKPIDHDKWNNANDIHLLSSHVHMKQQYIMRLL